MKRTVLSGFIMAAAALLVSTGAQQTSALEFTTEGRNLSGTRADIEVYAKSAIGPATLYSTLSLMNGEKKSAAFLSLTGICPSYVTGKVGTTTILQMTCSDFEKNL